ncbi:MAG: hypothetical protein J0I98_11455 [Mesorhizobium sp.]|nr:hypothetical protein [Mesorhizobium sp.]MBN9243400.1 hypothetical protein [Mesorhizobium sp.]
MSDIRVNDHAVLRYLERVVGLDVEALRATIGADCRRAQGAPSVNVGIARYIVRGDRVVTVLDGETIPGWEFLRRIQREALGR